MMPFDDVIRLPAEQPYAVQVALTILCLVPTHARALRGPSGSAGRRLLDRQSKSHVHVHVQICKPLVIWAGLFGQPQ